MALFDLIGVICILVAAVAAPFMLVTWVRNATRPKQQRVFPVKSTLFFAVPVLIALFSGGISVYVGQYRLGQFLDSVSPNCSVSVDGHIVQNPREVIDTFRRVGPLPAHHSDFGRLFDVVLSDPPRQLSLWVARDHSDPHEYWVFFPSPSKLAFRARLKTDIGHVETTVFDAVGP